MNPRERNVSIFFDTVKIVEEGKYKTEKGDNVKLPIYVGKSEFYDKEIEINFDSLPTYNTEIEVINSDSFIAAKALKDEGLNCAVLNMASWVMPGGGVLKGSRAQEENLFRRSNLFQSLYRFKRPLAKEFDLKPKVKQYPLDVNFGAIHSEGITVFRGSEEENYKLLNEPFQVDVVSVAAYKDPQLENGKLPKEVKEIMTNKIKTIFNVCIVNNNDSIVLGAFGCGAYHNPPEEVAKLFKDILESDDYKNKFKKITFAILDSNSTHMEHNPNGNFYPFAKVFGKV